MSQLEKVYGVHAVEALLRHHPKRVKQLWLAESRQAPRVQALLELAAQNRVAVGHKERQELDEWAEGVHQGVVAEVSPSQVWGENMLDELLERGEGPALLQGLFICARCGQRMTVRYHKRRGRLVPRGGGAGPPAQ